MAARPDRVSPKSSTAVIVTVGIIALWQLTVSVPSVSRLWHPLGWFGYHANSDGAVTQVSPGSPADRAGLSSGDRFAVSLVPAGQRRFALGPLYLAPSPGYRLTLPVSAPGSQAARTIVMTAVSEPLSLPDDILILVRTFGAIVFVLVGASLVLMRPSAMTWALFFFTIGLNPGSDATFDAAIPPVLYPVNWTLETLSIAAGNAGFLAFALRFPHEEIVRWRRPIARVVPWLFGALGALGAYAVLAPYVAGKSTEFESRLFYALGSMVFVAGLAVLATTYAHAAGEDRHRIKWVIVGFAIGLPAFAMAALFELTSVFPYPPYWVIGVLLSLNLLAPAAIAYAVIRHHVIDVTFVISRAVVYAILTALLVAAFALADWLLGRQLASSGLTVAAEVGISIGFAFWVNSIHQRVNTFVDSTLFRSRHQAERRLERVAHALPHARATDAVSKLLVSEPVETLDLASAALFRRCDDDRFVREADVGWPAHCARNIEPDDKLVLHLQSELTPLPVSDVGWTREDLPTGLARPQLAVPVVVRKRLLAFVVYGNHARGGALDPDEVRILGALMTGASAAYDHIDAETLRGEALALQEQTQRLSRRVLELERELEKVRTDASMHRR